MVQQWLHFLLYYVNLKKYILHLYVVKVQI
jgi:hypothetical protein